jgi:hypothetical protein
MSSGRNLTYQKIVDLGSGGIATQFPQFRLECGICGICGICGVIVESLWNGDCGLDLDYNMQIGHF